MPDRLCLACHQRRFREPIKAAVPCAVPNVYQTPMHLFPTALGIVMLGLVARALVVGTASAGGDAITKRDEPLIYWLFVLGGICTGAYLIMVGFRPPS